MTNNPIHRLSAIADQLSAIDLPGIDTDRVITLAKDATYVTVGFGVLAVQKLQVRRHEFTEQAKGQLASGRQQLDAIKHYMTDNAAGIDARLLQLESTLDEVVDTVAARLPEPATTIVQRTHEAAKTVRGQIRGLIAA